ncbi:MAG TPA: branched-chain amino acid ABC transporter permease, partial [Desulfobulbus sp.]|nr:branched-chain amino acid ABC transporter permease [Desulfobulbus sp.]
MLSFKDFGRACVVALWFMVLTFPLMVIKVNPIDRVITWRWRNMLWVGVGSFLCYLASRAWQIHRDARLRRIRLGREEEKEPLSRRILQNPSIYRPLLAAGVLFFLAFPGLFSTYQTNIMITALMYVVLGLGLNIVVGVAGLLDLGYVAF